VNSRPTAIERAFELAASGRSPGLSEIKTKLAQEGYTQLQMLFEGPAIRRQIRQIILKARAPGSDEQP